MATQTNLKPTTLYTYGNRLTAEPGHLLIADNCVIDQPDAIEPRRGFFLYSQALESSTARVNQLLEYKGRLLAHIPGPDALYFDSNTAGTFSKFDGTYSQVESGKRIRGVEANGNLYFTTDEGIKKISATAASDLSTASGYIVDAGAPKATDLEITANNTSPGFMATNSTVAYRVVWGTTDANNNLILGAPSENVQFSVDGPLYLIQNLNDLLKSLDVAAQASTGDLLSDTDYLSSLVLSNEASTEDLRVNLVALASKLDRDFTITTAATAVSAELAGTLATLYFNAAVSSTYLNVGDVVAVSSISTTAVTALNSTTANPSWEIVSFASASAIQFNIPSASSGTVALTAVNAGVVVESYSFRNISAPTSIIVGQPTGNQFTDLISYYDDIVLQLQDSPSGFVDASLQPLGETSTDSIQTNVKFSVPPNITTANYTSWIYQVYRSAVVTASTGLTLADMNPGDELALVYEDTPTTAQLTSGFVTVVDNTPDSFRGVGLYSNANSGEGILQANDQPPVAADITTFRNSTFYANTRTKHQLNLTFLGVSNLQTAISSSVTSLSLSGSTLTLSFGSAVSSSVSAGDVLSLTGFSGSSETLNNYYVVTAVSASAVAMTSSVTGSFTDSATADFGAILKSESLTITQGASAETYKFVTVAKEKTKFIFPAASALDVGATAGYITLNSATNENAYYVYFPVGSATADPAVSGRTGIAVSAATGDAASTLCLNFVNTLQIYFDFNSENTSATGATAYVENYEFGMATDASVALAATAVTSSIIQQGFLEDSTLSYVGLYSTGTPSQNIFDTSKSFLRVVNRRPSGLYNGYYTSALSDTPGKINLTTRSLGTTAFRLTASTTAAGSSFDPTVPTSGSTVISNNQTYKNGLYYSKTNQPEAVPGLVNFQRVGQQDKAILRIIALRDSLFILKEEGVYRLSGDSPSNFSLFLFDTGARLIAADSAVSLNNQIYCWTTQGIVTISDAGVEIISRPIENQLNKLLNISNYNTIAHAANYDLDRAYLLWVPEAEGDDIAPQCFRYNFITRAWTRWPIEKDCAHVLTSDNKLYLGAGDTNYVEKERKDFDRIDYCDREITRTIGPNSVIGSTYFLNSVNNVERNDVIAQVQYVSLSEYNLLINKLDLDPSVISASADNFSSISGEVGDSMADNLVALAQQIDSTFSLGLSTASAVTSASDAAPSTQQTAYNYITNTLNGASSISFTNYPSLTGYSFFESVIDQVAIQQVSVTSAALSVTSAVELPLIQGDVLIYKHIQSDIQWVPQHFGNPAILKHMREISLMFEATNFKRATIGFATDLLPVFEDVEFDMEGDGIFGYANYGGDFYGGGGNERPLRTLVPRNKQRARFLNLKFTHEVSRSKWTLYGVAVVGEMNGIENKAYR